MYDSNSCLNPDNKKLILLRPHLGCIIKFYFINCIITY